MTIAVIFLVMLAIAGSLWMWCKKKWRFESAFLIMFMAVCVLALYTIQMVNTDNLRDNDYASCQRGAQLRSQLNAHDTTLHLTVIDCDKTFDR